MRITLTDIRWRDQETSEVFNIHEIQCIELDEHTNTVTIVGAAGIYRSPYCDLVCDNYFTHLQFTCMKPDVAFPEFITIVVIECKGIVAIKAGPKHCDPWFEYRCRTYCATEY